MAEPSRIARGTRVRGTVRGAEPLIVAGRIDGRIELEAGLIVERDGVVVAEVRAHSVELAGLIVGDVVAAHVHLRASARLVGSIDADRLIVEPGARLRGEVEARVSAPGVGVRRSERREGRASFVSARPLSGPEPWGAERLASARPAPGPAPRSAPRPVDWPSAWASDPVAGRSEPRPPTPGPEGPAVLAIPEPEPISAPSGVPRRLDEAGRRRRMTLRPRRRGTGGDA